ncbi:MAG: hypothetical protein PHU03_01770 [Syntrophales bacterium]|nr:hypothetical protein [Syntrophales bacterium]
MGYFEALLRVLKIDESVYPEITSKGLPVWYSTINVAILGLVYGFSSLYFHSEAGALISDFADPTGAVIVKAIIVSTGVIIAFFVHMGGSFLFWAFCRALGGWKTRFLPTYFTLGVASAPLWTAAPGMAALHAGGGGHGVYLYLSVTGLYAFSSLFVAAKSTFGFSYSRMFLAVAMMLIFTVSFLLLWGW